MTILRTPWPAAAGFSWGLPPSRRAWCRGPPRLARSPAATRFSPAILVRPFFFCGCRRDDRPFLCYLKSIQRCPLGEHASPRVHRAAGGAAAGEALAPPKHSVMTIPPSFHIFAGEGIEW